MSNSYFKFKQFTIHQDRCAMKVTTDSCLFGAWVAADVKEAPPAGLKDDNMRVLDIGAGTGLLSLMFAQEHVNARIAAVELDEDAAGQAIENIAASPWKMQVNIVYKDIKDFHVAGLYDIIISNPPFHEGQLQSGNLKKDKAHHAAGLLVEELLRKAATLLKEHGYLYLLLPYYRTTEVLDVAAGLGLFPLKKIYIRKSVNHACSRTILQLGRLTGNLLCEEEIIIDSANGGYSQEFIKLMNAYYLRL